jgi:hypothetical protein
MFAHHETCNDPVLHHSGNSPKEFTIKEDYHLFATMMAEKSINTYVDVHCWQFTPETFTAISNFLFENDLIDLKLLESETKKTELNTFEFFVTLQKVR